MAEGGMPDLQRRNLQVPHPLLDVDRGERVFKKTCFAECFCRQKKFASFLEKVVAIGVAPG